MLKAAQASALILLLACSAQAGWIGNETPAPPPSSPAIAGRELAGDELTTCETTAGEIPDDAKDALTHVGIELLAVLPSLL
jgi:hypothetical protein